MYILDTNVAVLKDEFKGYYLNHIFIQKMTKTKRVNTH